MVNRLILIKNEALQRGLVGKIITDFENKGFKIIGLKMISVTEDIIKKLYKDHEDKKHFKRLIKYSTISPIIVIVVECYNGCDIIKGLQGKYDIIGSIRGKYVQSSQQGLVHISDEIESTSEISLFFSDDEFSNYEHFLFNEYKY